MKNLIKRIYIINFSKNCFLPFVCSVLLVSCATVRNKQVSTSKDTIKAVPELIFRSGFESGSKVIPLGNDADIVGTDNSLPTKNNWVEDLEKNGDANFKIEYTGGDNSKRYADIIPEPGNPSNHLLHFWLNDSWLADGNAVKSRVQTDIYQMKPGLKEFYQSVRVFLTDDFNEVKKYPSKISWLTISEFWNNEWWVPTEKYGFRVTLGIGKPKAEEGDLYFILNAENAGQKEVWHAKDNDVKVPIGKWFTMEYYYKEGDAQTGRFYMAITPDGGNKQVVFDVKNFTHNTYDPKPDGVTGYNPMKLYTSKELVAFMKSRGKTLQIYWDDFKLWKNKRPE